VVQQYIFWEINFSTHESIWVDIIHAANGCWPVVLCLNRILGTLTQALQSSGVDLTQASVSVDIDVGRRANTGLTPCQYSSKVCYTLFFFILWPCKIYSVFCLFKRIFYCTSEIKLDDLMLPKCMVTFEITCWVYLRLSREISM
jgi:hypothetical protein